MVTLNETDFISSGDRRDCYRHPTDSGLCIKILKDCRKARVQQRREIKYYQRLAGSQVKLTHIAKYFGSVQTNLGLGYLYERVRNYDGGTSQTIAEAFADPATNVPALYDQLDALLGWLRTEKIAVCDMRSVNVMLQKKAPDQSHLVVVDGIGDAVAIPIFNLIPGVLDRKIVRRWQRGDLANHKAVS